MKSVRKLFIYLMLAYLGTTLVLAYMHLLGVNPGPVGAISIAFGGPLLAVSRWARSP